jgi:cysteine-rich repeat protein
MAGYEGGLEISITRGEGESLEHYINQVCKEICGDGVLKGQLACDDGNQRDGDGCSSTCTIELGWACVNPSGISVCNDTTAPTAQLTYSGLSDSVYIFLLTFSENVIYRGDITITIGIDMIQLFTFTTKQTVTSSGITAIQIELSAKERVKAGAILTLVFPTPETIKDASGNSLITKRLSATIRDDYTPISSLNVEKIAQATGPISGAVASMAVLNTAFSSSNFNAVWSLVDILQIINYIIYMSAALPDHLKSFLRQLSFANFEFIPSFFESSSDEFPSPPVPFENEGIGSDFLINIGNMVTIWAALLGAFLVLVVLCKCLPSISFLMRVKSLFVFSVFIRCGTESFLQLALGVCLQLREASPHSTFGGFSLAASLLISLYLCFLLAMTVSKVSLQVPSVLSQKPYITRFGSLYETFKLENRISRSFLLLQNFRRLAFVLFLVFLSKWPLLQAILCFVLSLLYLAALIVWRPEKEWWLGNFMQIASEGGLALVHCLICVLADEGLTYDLRSGIGWVALAILLILILANIGVIAYMQFKATKQFLSRVNTYLSRKHYAHSDAPLDTDRTWSEDFKRVPAVVPHTDPSFRDLASQEPDTASMEIRPVFSPIVKS